MDGSLKLTGGLYKSIDLGFQGDFQLTVISLCPFIVPVQCFLCSDISAAFSQFAFLVSREDRYLVTSPGPSYLSYVCGHKDAWGVRSSDESI